MITNNNNKNDEKYTPAKVVGEKKIYTIFILAMITVHLVRIVIFYNCPLR